MPISVFLFMLIAFWFVGALQAGLMMWVSTKVVRLKNLSIKRAIVWGLIASLLIANVVLLLMNVPMVKIFVKILMVPPWVLLPGVTMISFVGIYSLSGSYFDLLLMVGFGVLGYILRQLDIPTVPVILVILLGGNMENALRRAMVLSDGDATFLFSSPISIGLWVAAIAGFVAPMFLRRFLTKPQAVPD